MTLGERDAITDIAIRLARGAVITGTLRDPQNEPLAGVSVAVINVDNASPSRPAPVAQTASTDDRGVYRFFGLSPGKYVVYMPRPQTTGEMRKLTSREIDAALASLQARTGRSVPSGPGIPAGGIPPGVDPNTPARVTTLGFAPVFYPGTPIAGQATTISLSIGEERSGIDFPVDFVRTGSIEGTIVNPENVPVQMILTPADTLLPLTSILVPTLTPPGPDGRFKYRQRRARRVHDHRAVVAERRRADVGRDWRRRRRRNRRRSRRVCALRERAAALGDGRRERLRRRDRRCDARAPARDAARGPDRLRRGGAHAARSCASARHDDLDAIPRIRVDERHPPRIGGRPAGAGAAGRHVRALGCCARHVSGGRHPARSGPVVGAVGHRRKSGRARFAARVRPHRRRLWRRRHADRQALRDLRHPADADGLGRDRLFCPAFPAVPFAWAAPRRIRSARPASDGQFTFAICQRGTIWPPPWPTSTR